MAEGELSRRLGRLLRLERERAGMSQLKLATRAGVKRQEVSVFETGQRQPTTKLVEAMFGALGLQLRLEVEEIDSDLDEAIERAAASLAKGAATGAAAGSAGSWAESLLSHLEWLRDFASGAPPMLVDGSLAAYLLGVPIEPRWIGLAVAEGDLDLLAGWMSRLLQLRRYEARTRDFTGWVRDPREPGELRWTTGLFELRVKILPVLTPIVVRFGAREVEVRALPDVTADHPEVARVIERAKRSLRERSLS